MTEVQEKPLPQLPLAQSAHSLGCPASRVENYEVKGPESKGSKIVTVVRCADCGGQETLNGRMALLIKKTTEGLDKNVEQRSRNQTEQKPRANAGT